MQYIPYHKILYLTKQEKANDLDLFQAYSYVIMGI